MTEAKALASPKRDCVAAAAPVTCGMNSLIEAGRAELYEFDLDAF